jgi:hypothetical protein
MRGDHIQQTGMFSYLAPGQRVPVDHPLRAIREFADGILDELSEMLDKMYSPIGRRSFAPEKLSRALLQVLYSVAQRALADGGVELQPAVPLVRGFEHGRRRLAPTVYSKNRDRLLEAEVARKFFEGMGDRGDAVGVDVG